MFLGSFFWISCNFNEFKYFKFSLQKIEVEHFMEME